MSVLRELKPDEMGVILATELTSAVLNNESIKPIHGVTFEGDINLNSADYNHKLIIRNSTFKGHFDVGETCFSRSLDLTGCTFENNVNFSDTRIERNLVLTQATIKAVYSEFQVINNFERVHVQGILDAKALESKVSLNFNHSYIGKLVLCSLNEKRTTCRDIRLLGAKIAYQFDCSGAHIDGDLILQGVNIEGDLFCNTEESYCTKIDGEVSLLGAKILGRVDLSGANIQKALNLDSAEIRGALDCKPEQDKNENWHYTEIGGDAYLGGSLISPIVNFSGAKIKGNLSLQSAEILGNVFCNFSEGHRTEIGDKDNEAGGKAEFTGVKITGSIELKGAKIAGDLDLKGADIKGDVCCRSEKDKRTEVGGNLSLVEAQVLGSIDLRGAKIFKDLDLKRSEIKSKLECEVNGDERTEIEKNVNLAGAKVLGSVNFSGAKVLGDLVLKGVEIAGSLHCRSHDQKFWTKIGGKVNLTRARISSSVDFSGAKIQGGLELYGAELTSYFHCNLSKINCCINCSSPIQDKDKKWEANLEDCSIRCLRIDIDSSNHAKLNLAFSKVIRLEIKGSLPEKEKINLEGFEFQELELPDMEGDGNKYIQFLEATIPFDEGTYLFLENWLRNQGAQIDANLVYVKMRRRNRREKISLEIKSEKSLWSRWWTVPVQVVWNWILDITILYGTATNRLFFFYFLPVLMVSWLLVFSNANSVELDWAVTASDLSNSQVIELANSQEPRIKDVPSIHPTTWTSRDAFWLAVKVSLPVISFTPSDKWTPSSQPIVCITKGWCSISYDDYAKFFTLLSWIVVPLFLAGISGIVKKQP